MAKPIYEMSVEEIVAFINAETKSYVELVFEEEQVPVGKYFNTTRFNNEDLYNLYFACDVMFNTPYGKPYRDNLAERALEMFEPLQVEFRKRLGHPDPYGASTVIKL